MTDDREAAPATRAQRWVRVPKAVVVTVLGLALSAWLIPAMTRQWDDRQKEHELKAGVVADMASVTARALVGGEAFWSGERMTAQEREQLGRQWALSALGIEAQLRTYFSSSMVAGWQVYSWAVDRFINARSVSSSAALKEAVGSGVALDPRVADAAAQLLVLGETTTGPVPTFAVDASSSTKINDRKYLDRLKAMLSPEMKRYEAAPVVATWPALEKGLLGFEQAVADQVLRSHATGFSTTTKDLLHDLLP